MFCGTSMSKCGEGFGILNVHYLHVLRSSIWKIPPSMVIATSVVNIKNFLVFSAHIHCQILVWITGFDTGHETRSPRGISNLGLMHHSGARPVFAVTNEELLLPHKWMKLWPLTNCLLPKHCFGPTSPAVISGTYTTGVLAKFSQSRRMKSFERYIKSSTVQFLYHLSNNLSQLFTHTQQHN